jgi:hypothetical protein
MGGKPRAGIPARIADGDLFKMLTFDLSNESKPALSDFFGYAQTDFPQLLFGLAGQGLMENACDARKQGFLPDECLLYHLAFGDIAPDCQDFSHLSSLVE